MADLVSDRGSAAGDAAQARADTAWDQSPSDDEVIVRADSSGVILFVSPACRRLGYEPEDLVGRLGVELVHPDDRERFLRNTASLFETTPSQRPAYRVHRYRRGDGVFVWLPGNPIVLPGPDGRKTELINILRPIRDWA